MTEQEFYDLSFGDIVYNKETKEKHRVSFFLEYNKNYFLENFEVNIKDKAQFVSDYNQLVGKVNSLLEENKKLKEENTKGYIAELTNSLSSSNEFLRKELIDILEELKRLRKENESLKESSIMFEVKADHLELMLDNQNAANKKLKEEKESLKSMVDSLSNDLLRKEKPSNSKRLNILDRVITKDGHKGTIIEIIDSGIYHKRIRVQHAEYKCCYNESELKKLKKVKVKKCVKCKGAGGVEHWFVSFTCDTCKGRGKVKCV